MGTHFRESEPYKVIPESQDEVRLRVVIERHPGTMKITKKMKDGTKITLVEEAHGEANVVIGTNDELLNSTRHVRVTLAVDRFEDKHVHFIQKYYLTGGQPDQPSPFDTDDDDDDDDHVDISRDFLFE